MADLEKLAAVTEGADVVDLSRLESAVADFRGAAEGALAEGAAILAHTSNADPLELNDRLMRVERHFLDLAEGGGLPKRPWFKHLLQAPGIFLGYGGAMADLLPTILFWWVASI